MSIELNAYDVICHHCAETTTIKACDIEGLIDDIEDEIGDARKNERADVEREFKGMIDPADHPIHARTIHDLSAAIERCDTGEARLLLDRVADDLGLEHKEAAQIGRFSSEARAA